MSLYQSKVLALILLPLGWAVLLGLAALVLSLIGRKRAASSVIAVQIVLLWACAMPWTAYGLTGWLEAAHPPVTLEQTPVADVAIVLGGAISAVGNPPVENLTGASDRVLRTARLFRAGKVSHVLAVGGNLPWLGGSVPEAEVIRDLLAEWGVPLEVVVTETTSRNTRENALFASEVVRAAGWERVLLVTSSAHMRRAVGAFREVGIDVIPSPTDYGVIGHPPFDFLDLLPDAEALGQTSAVMREVIGVLFYRWKGWLG